ncbi:MAG TPA: DMT family transporter, partial [Geminicoccaceae bacterium]|nr:DMT family transporter [Geminicoccaceae bacterium]
WSAVVAGFIGVLIVIRPGIGMPHWALALPLVTAVGFALYQILTRKVAGTPGETSVAMLFYLASVGAAVTTALVPFFWRTVAPFDWLPMAAMGLLGGLGHLILIRALTIAPASLLAPFVYTQIVWALILGYLVFGDLPDVWMLLGGAVIVASGLYVFYREAVLGRS